MYHMYILMVGIFCLFFVCTYVFVLSNIHRMSDVHGIGVHLSNNCLLLA